MAQQFISLIKFRRGLKNRRTDTKFEEGEPVFETDTRRFFIGVGDNDDADVGTETYGGTLVGNMSFIGPTDQNPEYDCEARAYTGDIMYAHNKLWRLSDSGYVDISLVPDGFTLQYDQDNKLYVTEDALQIVGGDGISVAPGRIVSITNSASNILKIINGELTIPEASITGNYISTSAFDNGQFTKDTSGTLSINFNTPYFDTLNGISIAAIPLGSKEDTPNNDASDNQTSTAYGAISSYFGESGSTQTGLEFTDGDVRISSSIALTEENENQIVGVQPGVKALLTSNKSNQTAYNGTIDSAITSWAGSNRDKIIVYTKSDISQQNALNQITLNPAGFIVFKAGMTADSVDYKPFAVPVFSLPEDPVVYMFYNDSSEVGGGYLRGINLSACTLTYTVYELSEQQVEEPVLDENGDAKYEKEYSDDGELINETLVTQTVTKMVRTGNTIDTEIVIDGISTENGIDTITWSMPVEMTDDTENAEFTLKTIINEVEIDLTKAPVIVDLAIETGDELTFTLDCYNVDDSTTYVLEYITKLDDALYEGNDTSNSSGDDDDDDDDDDSESNDTDETYEYFTDVTMDVEVISDENDRRSIRLTWPVNVTNNIQDNVQLSSLKVTTNGTETEYNLNGGNI